MELIERPDLNAVNYLSSIKYDDFRKKCIDSANENGENTLNIFLLFKLFVYS